MSLLSIFTYSIKLKKKLVQEGKTELYYYNGDKLVYITDGSHNLKYFFLRDITGKVVNMIDYSGVTPETYWYLYDAHGNVVGLSDKNGNKVASYEYDAWGNILSQSSTVNTGDGVALWKANPFRYSGYQYDDETRMYYLKSRYYSPFLGRFITRDAVFALNLYKYAANNPVNYVDPNGYYHARLEDVEIGHQSTMHGDGFGHRDNNYYVANVGYKDTFKLYTVSAEADKTFSMEDRNISGEIGVSAIDIELQSGTIGNDSIAASASGELEILTAEANGSLRFGKGAYGFSGELFAAGASYSGTGVIEICGFKISLTGEGFAGAAGGQAELVYNHTKGVSLGFKAAALFGVGGRIEIEW